MVLDGASTHENSRGLSFDELNPPNMIVKRFLSTGMIVREVVLAPWFLQCLSEPRRHGRFGDSGSSDSCPVFRVPYQVLCVYEKTLSHARR